MVTVRDVIAQMQRIAPESLAISGDRVGLQIGRWDKPVKRVGLALDPYPEVIDAAVSQGLDLLITHHAMLFRPVSHIDTGTARGRALARALAADLAVYAAHTNLDIAAGGVNDVLVGLLGLQEAEVLDRTHNERLYKLVVFVPKEHHEQVLQAVCAAGAGHIGNYSHCTFNTDGTGTFLPGEGTQPFIGQHGRLERVQEVRLETIVPEQRLEAVVQAMLAAHPYEEVAYDVYPLELAGKAYGLGRVGNLPSPVPLAQFANHVRSALGLPHLRYSGCPDMMVQRVAVVGGSGGKWAAQALARGAQVLVTADCDHHTVAEAWHDGLAIVEATHAAMERPVLPVVAQALQAALPDEVSIEVLDVREDPFLWI